MVAFEIRRSLFLTVVVNWISPCFSSLGMILGRMALSLRLEG